MPNLRPISTSARSANGEMLFEAQLHQLEALAKRRPVLMVFEDAHWIDPTSRELLDLTFDRVRLLPVLLIVTFRPEFRHAWGGQPQVTVLALNQLGGSERQRGAGRGTCRQCGSFPRDRRRDLERAAGVPLFVEELYNAQVFSRPAGIGRPDRHALRLRSIGVFATLIRKGFP